MVGGFKESPLKLNQGLGSLDTWDEETIQKKATRLSKTAIQVWAYPDLSPEVLAAHETPEESSGYSIADHPYLLLGNVHLLFEAFRKEVMALDPCVTEEILEVICGLQGGDELRRCCAASEASASVTQPCVFGDNDPKGMCKDVSGVGRWVTATWKLHSMMSRISHT